MLTWLRDKIFGKPVVKEKKEETQVINVVYPEPVISPAPLVEEPVITKPKRKYTKKTTTKKKKV